MDSFYCYSCFTSYEKVQIKPYTIRNEGLKSIFETQHVPLCYICWRLAERCEVFIDSVQISQETLLLTTTPPKEDSKSRPTLRLSTKRIDPISITVLEEGKENTTLDSECSKDIEISYLRPPEIKSEPCETIKYDSDDQETYYYDYEQETNECVKDEDIKGEYLKDLVKFEGKENKHKPKKRKLKRKKEPTPKRTKTVKECTVKEEYNKIKLEVKDKHQYTLTPVHISLEQLKLEQEEKCKSAYYLSMPYRCTDCIQGFKSESEYQKHMKLHSVINGGLICDICKQRRCTFRKLTQHILTHTIRYPCQYCQKVFTDKKTLRSHLSTYHLNDEHKCEHCNKVFRERKKLTKHVRYKHIMETVICGHCNKKYVNKECLKLHLQRMHPSEISQKLLPPKQHHKCDVCGKSFGQLAFLERHRTRHSDKKEYYCVECDKRYKTSQSLKRHLTITSIHVNVMDLPLGCEYCEKRFGIRRQLNHHVNIVHNKAKPFRCKSCPKVYFTKGGLDNHTRYKHDGAQRPRIFPCSYCDKIFNRPQILREHIRIHTGERPFQCDRCPATFTQRSVLMSHVRCTHLNVQRNGRPKNR